jgi:hypothetical protein
MRSNSVITLLLISAAILLAQTVQQKGTLVVKGFAGQAPLIQVRGKSYVDLESLARMTNGSLSFQGNQVTLTLNGSAGAAAPPATAAPPVEEPPKPQRLSPDLVRAGVNAMAAAGEWRQALASAVQYNTPLGDDFASGYRRNIEGQLVVAASAGVSDDDRNLVQLLRGAVTKMQTLSDKYLALRKSLTYVAPDAMDDDPLNLAVLNCAQGLRAMAASGTFQDVAACH